MVESLVHELQVAGFMVKATTGVHSIDAQCMITRAKTLVLSMVLTFSQIAALLANSTALAVHYPTSTLSNPPVTLKVGLWWYHLVNQNHSAISEYDVEHDRISVTSARLLNL